MFWWFVVYYASSNDLVRFLLIYIVCCVYLWCLFALSLGLLFVFIACGLDFEVVCGNFVVFDLSYCVLVWVLVC